MGAREQVPFHHSKRGYPDTSWSRSVRRSLLGASGMNLRSPLSWRRTGNLLQGVCTYIILYSAFKIQRRGCELVPSPIADLQAFCLCLFQLGRNLFFSSGKGLGNCLMTGALHRRNLICIHFLNVIHPHPAELSWSKECLHLVK